MGGMHDGWVLVHLQVISPLRWPLPDFLAMYLSCLGLSLCILRAQQRHSLAGHISHEDLIFTSGSAWSWLQAHVMTKARILDPITKQAGFAQTSAWPMSNLVLQVSL